MNDRPSYLLSAVGAWMTSGTLAALAVALTLQLTGTPGALEASLFVLLGSTLAGLAAWKTDRALAEGRPAVLDQRGKLRHPPHALVYGLPLVFAVPSMLVLLLVATVAMGSGLPALVFGIGGFGLGWASRRLVSTHRVTAALQALELGETQAARTQLELLEAGWMSTRGGRTTARLNLGMLALSQGDLQRAAVWYGRVRDGRAAPLAQAGLALVRALEDRLDEAEALVIQALAAENAEDVQGQLDAVRLLLTLRQEGAHAARSLGRTLSQPGSGELFRGLHAYATLQAGFADEALSLTAGGLCRALEDSGWGRIVPEIGELLVEPELSRPA